MKTENMLKVADFIERENSRNIKAELNMRQWFGMDGVNWDRSAKQCIEEEFCGTTACIGGTANLLHMLELATNHGKLDMTCSSLWDEYGADENEVEKARKWLGLTEKQADDLFYTTTLDDQIPESRYSRLANGYDYINDRRHLVPDALRWMAAKKKVDWKVALDAAQAAADCRAKNTPVQESA